MSQPQDPPCGICHSNSNPITLPCGCSQTCFDCLCQWVFLKISRVQPSGLDQKILYPIDVCQKDFTILQIYSEMPEFEKNRLNEALLKIYLSKEPNIQRCPKQGCDYAILVDESSSCCRELQCELCQTKWGSNEEKNGFFKKLFGKFRDVKDEILTSFWKNFKAKKCPGCKVLISREPIGCEMMTCTQCHFQFCWYCFKDEDNCHHFLADDD